MQKSETFTYTGRRGWIALTPVIVFLGMYLGVSAAVGDFYKMPIAVAMLTASVWAIIIAPGRLSDRIDVFSKAAGHSNILYMIWIFVLAGSFSALAKGIGSVDAAVGAVLSIIPVQWIVPGMFASACLISMSIGTSVGTVVALTPLAMDMASEVSVELPVIVASVISGAFFGDNLSFISDTTVAATRSQGCSMQSKFKANIWICLPAALATLGIYIAQALTGDAPTAAATVAGGNADWLLTMPYLLVILLALCGINVALVLTAGITATLGIALLRGGNAMDAAGMMGEGIDSMGNLIIITIMAAGMLGIVKETGGIEMLLRVFTRGIKGSRGAQAVIAALVGVVNLCTANNTVAIITTGSISRRLSEKFGVTPRKSASLLDTGSCIVQCLIPYGAQTLLATALAGISPAAPWPYLYYTWMLAVALGISILVRRKNPAAQAEQQGK